MHFNNSSLKLHPFESKLYDYFSVCLSQDPDAVPEIGVTIPIPTLTQEECIQLCDNVKPLFLEEPNILKLNSPLYVVGDLHGNIYDLIRILVMTEGAPKNKFLFLGDYVDRGPYSVEVTALLFILKILYPKNIFLIRGNHEFRNINETYGFKEQALSAYASDDVYEAFNKAFDCLPFAAIIEDQVFAVHGGISPDLKDLSQISEVKRPMDSCDVSVLKDLMWSDPDKKILLFKESARGDGFLFGEQALDLFFAKFGFVKLLRAHQCVRLGIDKFFNEKGYTIFSSSSYDLDSKNRCGLLYIGIEKSIQTFSLPPITPIPRETALLAKGSEIVKRIPVPECNSYLALPKCQVVKAIPMNLSNTRKRKNTTQNFYCRAMSHTSSMLTFNLNVTDIKNRSKQKSNTMPHSPSLILDPIDI